MAVEQVAGVVSGFFAGFHRAFGRLFGFAIQRRLVDLDVSSDDFAIGGDLVPGLQEDDVPDHDFTDMDLCQTAVPDDLGHFLGLLFRLQGRGLVLLVVFADGRDAIGDGDGDEDRRRLEPFGLVEQKQHQLNQQSRQQDHDHRIAEAAEDASPQRFRRQLGQDIGAIGTAAGLNRRRR